MVRSRSWESSRATRGSNPHFSNPNCSNSRSMSSAIRCIRLNGALSEPQQRKGFWSDRSGVAVPLPSQQIESQIQVNSQAHRLEIAVLSLTSGPCFSHRPATILSRSLTGPPGRSNRTLATRARIRNDRSARSSPRCENSGSPIRSLSTPMA